MMYFSIGFIALWVSEHKRYRQTDKVDWVIPLRLIRLLALLMKLNP